VQQSHRSAAGRKRRTCRRLLPWSSARGQGLAELALLLPLFLVIALGAVDLGRFYYSYVTVTNSARSGAAFAAQNPANSTDLPGITSAALQEVSGLSASPTVTSSTGNDASGATYVRVTVQHTYSTLFDLPGLPSSVQLQRTVQMRVAP
jgi:Flp pilus assembly protein TadG